jgi:hypothetical protein
MITNRSMVNSAYLAGLLIMFPLVDYFSRRTYYTYCYNFLPHVTVGPASDHVEWPAQLLESRLAYFVLGVTLTADSGLGFITCVLVSLVRCLWHHATLCICLQTSLGVLTHRLGHAH